MNPSLLSRLFSQAIRKGYQFCSHCQKVHSVGVEEIQPCLRCKRKDSTWNPACLPS
jgi:hypothetical protein